MGRCSPGPGSPVRSTSVFSGLSAWRREPELYQNTSDMSPVDSLVLTMLSPSEPPGRVSVLTVMSGLAFSNAAITAFAGLTVVSALSVSRVISVLPELEPEELEQAASGMSAEAATTAIANLEPELFMGEPPQHWGAHSRWCHRF